MTAPLVDPQLAAFDAENIGPESEGDPRDLVAYEIAAAVLVGLTLVRRAMAQEKAPVDPSGSAQKLWREHAPLWLRVAVPAVRQAYSLGQMGTLTEDELQKLATDYAANLGDYVSATSADALADGFNRQLAAGWNTEVAWQRATVGYGLERREMRSYLDGVMLGAKGGSADIVPAAARALVDKAILRRADNIGMSESWTAMQTGQALAWMALYRAGRLPAGAMKEWDVAEQATTCAICRYLHGQQVPPDQPFILPDGSKIWAPEVHPRCECRIKLVVPVEISKVDLKAAGVAVRALDTGRVLMLQRALDDKDPASGTWEFPGGCIEGGEHPAQAAEREWSEEVGRRFPKGKLAGHWTSGRYQGFVWDIEHEADIPIHRGRGSIINPDDPDGDQVEQLAWWDPEQLVGNPAVRQELRDSLDDALDALTQPISKAFDPQEGRNELGQWVHDHRKGLLLAAGYGGAALGFRYKPVVALARSAHTMSNADRAAGVASTLAGHQGSIDHFAYAPSDIEARKAVRLLHEKALAQNPDIGHLTEPTNHFTENFHDAQRIKNASGKKLNLLRPADAEFIYRARILGRAVEASDPALTPTLYRSMHLVEDHKVGDTIDFGDFASFSSDPGLAAEMGNIYENTMKTERESMIAEGLHVAPEGATQRIYVIPGGQVKALNIGPTGSTPTHTAMEWLAGGKHTVERIQNAAGFDIYHLKPQSEVGKAFDPQERRDQTGRWTKVAERDATVDAIMDEARAQKPEAPSPLRTMGPSPLMPSPLMGASPLMANPFLGASPFPVGGNPLLPAGNGPNPLVQRNKQYAQRVLLLIHTPPKGGEARREGTYYLPLSEVAEAYEMPYEPGLEQVGGTVDFDEINDAARATYADPDFGGLIAAQANTPWHAVDVDSALGWTDPEDVDEHWAKVLPLAVQASQRAVLDTPDIAQRLDQQDLAAIFTQAGYDSSEPNESKRSRLVDATQKIGSGNDSLAAAYIDYVVYHRPELFGALGSDLGRAIEEAEAANVPVTGAVHDLLTFQDGFHDNRRGETHLADLHATYEVTGATYHSALLEQGLDARAGAIGVRELFCKPARTEE